MKAYIIFLILLIFIPQKQSYALIGGREAHEDELPSSIVLGEKSPHNKKHYAFCSGVKVAEGLILTAAHCLSQSDLKEGDVLSSSSQRRPTQESYRETRIQEIIESPVNLRGRTDLVLIRTNNASHPTVPPASLGRYRISRELQISGHGCEGLGGPAGYKLKTAKVSPSGMNSLSINVPSTPRSGLYPSLCPGDSGGGAYQEDSNGLKRLVAINSSIAAQGDAGSSKLMRIDHPDIHTWLSSQIQGSSLASCR